MKNSQFTNSEIAVTDWAHEDRAKALFSLNKRKYSAPPRNTLDSGWGRDVSANDKRSVKAQLAGRGDFRAAWWNAFSAVHILFVRGATVEQAMFRFHSVHHWLTLASMTFMLDVRTLQANMARKGIVAALHGAVVAAPRRR